MDWNCRPIAKINRRRPLSIVPIASSVCELAFLLRLTHFGHPKWTRKPRICHKQNAIDQCGPLRTPAFPFKQTHRDRPVLGHRTSGHQISQTTSRSVPKYPSTPLPYLLSWWFEQLNSSEQIHEVRSSSDEQSTVALYSIMTQQNIALVLLLSLHTPSHHLYLHSVFRCVFLSVCCW